MLTLGPCCVAGLSRLLPPDVLCVSPPLVPTCDTLADERETDDREENDTADAGGDCGGRGIDAGSTLARTPPLATLAILGLDNVEPTSDTSEGEAFCPNEGKIRFAGGLVREGGGRVEANR